MLLLSRASNASCVAAAFFLFFGYRIFFCQNYSGIRTGIFAVPSNTTGAAWNRMEPPYKLQILQEPHGDSLSEV